VGGTWPKSERDAGDQTTGSDPFQKQMTAEALDPFGVLWKANSSPQHMNR